MSSRRTRNYQLASLAVLAALIITPSAAALTSHPRSAVSHRAGAAATRTHHKAALNPRHNVTPHPNYIPLCATRGYTDPGCITEELAAISNARKKEHINKPPMILPRNFARLTSAEQVFVVTDLERVDRGRRPFQGLTASLNHAAQAAAVAHLDPTIGMSMMRNLKIYSYGSIWAGDLGPLGADYDWMYNDGYSRSGDVNIGCPTRTSAGCWGHRDNILGSYGHLPSLTAGAGSSKPAGASLAEILTGGSGKAPAFVYTWKAALAHGADGHRVTR